MILGFVAFLYLMYEALVALASFVPKLAEAR